MPAAFSQATTAAAERTSRTSYAAARAPCATSATPLPQIANVLITNREGVVTFSLQTPQLLGLNLSDRQYIKDAIRRGGKMVVGAPIISRATGRRVTPLAWALRDAEGAVQGVMTASLDADFFYRYMDRLNARDGTRVVILAQSGEALFVFPLPTDKEGARALLDITHREEMFGQSLNEEPRPREGAIGNVRDNWLVTSRALPESRLVVGIASPFSQVTSAWRQRTVIFSTSALILVGLGLAGLHLARRSEMQLRQSRDAAFSAANQAQEARGNLETIFAKVDDGLIVFDADGTIEQMNPAAATMLAEMWDADLRDALVELSSRAVDDAGGGARQTRLPNVSGGTVEVETALSQFQKDGRLLTIATLRDVSERERLERLKNDFISSVNHELRTPLTSIMGSLGLLNKTFAAVVPEKPRRLIDIAHRNAARLLDLVNDILILQKLESGQMDYRREPVGAAALCADAVDLNNAYAGIYDVRLAVAPSITTDRILADPDRMIQVLTNLVSNAVKFSPPGGQVTLDAYADESDIVFTVHDDGPGVPVDFRPRLFQRFAQAGADDNARRGGTGLGLAISQAIVSHHGGRITVDTMTEDECGPEDSPYTTFMVRLPAMAAAAPRRRLRKR